MDRDRLQKLTFSTVRFGVDAENEERVGLAPVVRPVSDETLYH